MLAYNNRTLLKTKNIFLVDVLASSQHLPFFPLIEFVRKNNFIYVFTKRNRSKTNEVKSKYKRSGGRKINERLINSEIQTKKITRINAPKRNISVSEPGQYIKSIRFTNSPSVHNASARRSIAVVKQRNG